jgi:hypothetical protein
MKAQDPFYSGCNDKNEPCMYAIPYPRAIFKKCVWELMLWEGKYLISKYEMEENGSVDDSYAETIDMLAGMGVDTLTDTTITEAYMNTFDWNERIFEKMYKKPLTIVLNNANLDLVEYLSILN